MQMTGRFKFQLIRTIVFNYSVLQVSNGAVSIRNCKDTYGILIKCINKLARESKFYN